jgi:N-acetylglucosamine kinase-like BadF-type ATPase
MRYVLGFDGGGTKTECVLMNDSGAILARSRSGASNPVNLGVNASLAALLEAAASALTLTGVSANDVGYVYAGIAGAGDTSLRDSLQFGLHEKFPNALVHITSDLVLSLEATLESPSVVVIAGTGSAALGRTPAGKIARAGGFGAVVGDPGSAYDIGRTAVKLGLEHHFRGTEFSLKQEILNSFERDWADLLERARKEALTILPKIFPLIAQAAERGDTSARALIESAAQSLASLAYEVIEQLGLQQESFFLAKTGGVFVGSPLLNQFFETRVAELAPNSRVGPLPRSIAEAAAQLACDSLNTVSLKK